MEPESVELLRLILRNAFRQRLRTFLTILGMSVAVLAFCLLQTVVDAWYGGVAAASPNRLICRSAVSLIFPLPLSYYQKIRQVDGVRRVAYANWFAGVYIDERNFFPRIAIDSSAYLDLFPEFVLTEQEIKAFTTRKDACIVGRKIAKRYGWQVGDTIPLIGNIYPGDWRFVLAGIYKGATPSTDESQFFFRWDYLDEEVKKRTPLRAGQVGWYVVQVENPADSGEVSRSVDALFKNTSSETVTETEKAFQMGFVAMTEAIVVAVRVVSFVVIGVILLVVANTMAMTSRERMPEYAVLKALGFGNGFLAMLIAGESLCIAAWGGILGVGFAFPVAAVFADATSTLLPVFHLSAGTIVLCAALCIVIGLLSALAPIRQAAHTSVIEGLRHIG